MKLPGLLIQASSVLCSRPPQPLLSWRLFEHPQTPAVGPASPPGKVRHVKSRASSKPQERASGRRGSSRSGMPQARCLGCEMGTTLLAAALLPIPGRPAPISTPAAVLLVPTPPADSSGMGEL